MKYIMEQKDVSREKDIIDNFLSGIAANMKSFSPLYQHIAISVIFNVVSEYELELLMKTDVFSRASSRNKPRVAQLSSISTLQR